MRLARRRLKAWVKDSVSEGRFFGLVLFDVDGRRARVEGEAAETMSMLGGVFLGFLLLARVELDVEEGLLPIMGEILMAMSGVGR